MRELTPTVSRDILSINPKETFDGLTIPQGLAALRDYAKEQPEEATSRPTLNLGPVLSVSGDYALLALLLRDSAEWLKFFYYSVLYRSILHADEVVSGFNERAFVRVPVATRALLELFLYTFAAYRRIYQSQQEIKKLPPAQPRRAIESEIKLRDFLLKQAVGARINWDDPFGSTWQEVREHLKQTNVLSVMRILPGDQRDRVERWYALLSDACHPNFGSTLFVLDHERLTVDPPSFVFTRSRTGPIHLQLAIDLVSAAFCFSCVQLVNVLKLLEKVLAYYREGVALFGAKAGHEQDA